MVDKIKIDPLPGKKYDSLMVKSFHFFGTPVINDNEIYLTMHINIIEKNVYTDKRRRYTETFGNCHNVIFKITSFKVSKNN